MLATSAWRMTLAIATCEPERTAATSSLATRCMNVAGARRARPARGKEGHQGCNGGQGAGAQAGGNSGCAKGQHALAPAIRVIGQRLPRASEPGC